METPISHQQLDHLHRATEAGAVIDLLLNREHAAALDLAFHLQENLRREAVRHGHRMRRCWQELDHRDSRVASISLRATEHVICDDTETPADRAAAAAALRQFREAAALRAAPARERAATHGLRLINQ